jgi:hypothetical protein
MGNLRNGSQANRIENFSFGAKGINYPDELVHYGYYGLLVAPELFVLLFKISPKTPFPFHHAHRHLKQDVSQMRVALLGNTHLHFPFAGLFGYRVGPRVFDELFSAGKSLYLSHLGQKPGCKARRDSLDGGKISKLLSLGLVDFIFQELFELLYSRLQEEELLHIESEDFFESGMWDTDGVSSQRDHIRGREGDPSSRAGFLAVNHFGVEDEDVEAVREQEGEERDVESAGRFMESLSLYKLSLGVFIT